MPFQFLDINFRSFINLSFWLILFCFAKKTDLQATQKHQVAESDIEKPSSIVVSLGCHCAPAQYMSQFNVRQGAYPFDWLFTNHFEGFCRLLLNDFDNFLELEFLNIHSKLPFVVVNELYQVEFRHDFPVIGSSRETSVLDEDWRDYIPSIRDKFLRRIARFNQLAFYKGQVFFIRMAYNSPHIYEWPKVITRSEATTLRDILRKKFPETDFILVIVNYANEVASDEIVDWNLEGIKNHYISSYELGFYEIFSSLGLLQ